MRLGSYYEVITWLARIHWNFSHMLQQITLKPTNFIVQNPPSTSGVYIIWEAKPISVQECRNHTVATYAISSSWPSRRESWKSSFQNTLYDWRQSFGWHQRCTPGLPLTTKNLMSKPVISVYLRRWSNEVPMLCISGRTAMVFYFDEDGSFQGKGKSCQIPCWSGQWLTFVCISSFISWSFYTRFQKTIVWKILINKHKWFEFR